MAPLNPMTDLVESIRKSIEDPGLRRKHFGAAADQWSEFCVAMDTLEDTDLAISHFLAVGLGNSESERYLRLYGVLQAVFVQQDAIKAVWEIVMAEDFPEMPGDSSWRVIREIRNHSAGHPIEVIRQGIKKRTFVIRMNLEAGILSLITDENTGNTVHWGGNLREVVERYLAEAMCFLKVIHGRIPVIWPDLEV